MNWKTFTLGILVAIALNFIFEAVGMGDWLNGWFCCVSWGIIYDNKLFNIR